VFLPLRVSALGINVQFRGSLRDISANVDFLSKSESGITKYGPFAIGRPNLTYTITNLQILDPFLSIVSFKTIRFDLSRLTIPPIFLRVIP
jgi:hypothetical protein